MSDIISYIDQAGKIAGQIFNTAPAVFTALMVLAIGYALRLWRKFDNSYIPAACLFAGTILFSVLNENTDHMPAAKYWVRTVSLGFMVSLGTWLLHEKIISKIEDKIPWLGQALSRADADPPTKP